MNLPDYITDIRAICETVEHLKGFWDESGLDMHIAVKKGRYNTTTIAVDTKHWSRKHYIRTLYTVSKVWEMLSDISEEIGRKYIRSCRGPYVYIHKLNEDQTQSIFNIFKREFGDDITRAWELRWDISDATLPVF